MAALRESDLLRGLSDRSAGVREHAVRLATPSVVTSAEIRARVSALASDPAIRVRYHVAFAVGSLADEAAADVAHALLRRDSADRWVRAAVLGTTPDQCAKVAQRVLRDLALTTGDAGRELVRQLTADGCDVATCDVMEDTLAETVAICAADGNSGKVLTFIADVSIESQVLAFRDAVAAWRPHVNLLFNNAGIGGGGSIIEDDRESWEKTFGVCWYGVYYNTRAFLQLLLDAPIGHVVNTSSVNGFWASLGPNIPHTAYSAAKFAVKGFTEALITDFRMNAPTMRASVVMPGHIGTSIAINSRKLLGADPKEMTEEQIAQMRIRLAKSGLDVSGASDEDLRLGIQAQGESFRDNAPMSAAEASAVILNGVKRGDWRILVGADAAILDEMVREIPTDAYLPDFMERVQARGAFGAFTGN
jgi:NAD(P)-dependent dehydrogenase (short-subunit alcohol dehydrogenase family)